MASAISAPVSLPRVAITYCTQCRWMLRAAYFGQELLSTFGTQIGEIALIPATGGLFRVELTHNPEGEDVEPKKVLLWDRKAEGGFPETKVLKQLVRDHIDPKRDLGHSDRHGKKNEDKDEKSHALPKPEAGEANGEAQTSTKAEVNGGPDDTACEDCR